MQPSTDSQRDECSISSVHCTCLVDCDNQIWYLRSEGVNLLWLNMPLCIVLSEEAKSNVCTEVIKHGAKY